MTRYFAGALVAVAVLGAQGCIGIGPKHDRLYVSEWKSKRDHPVQVERDWVYQGEWWEHVVFVDERVPSPKRADEWPLYD